MLLADTWTRWHKLNPLKSTFFVTGTDEHGLKIQAVAEKEGISPQKLVDRVSQNFRQLTTDFNICNDRFIRTTDPDHVAAVEHFWNDLMEKGLIYKGSHSGWYCVSDEAFYPESQIKEITGPDGKVRKVSIELNNEVVFHEEHNYFFKMSDFQGKLIEHLKTTPDFIIPSKRQAELLQELESEKIEDLSISRPLLRLKWGIGVPGDKSQRIYVWFDALINYITAGGYPNAREFTWPATHVIGKDILRFHCVYWPTMLMAAGLALPKQVLVHTHWLSGGVKMSKSLGNVVDPFEVAQKYGDEPFRFFLMLNANMHTDCKYTDDAMKACHNMLINKWANLGNRLGTFNLEKAVARHENGEYSGINDLLLAESEVFESPEDIVKLKNQLLEHAGSLYENMDHLIESFGQLSALQLWWLVIDEANDFVQKTQPWRFKKLIANDGASSDHDRELVRDYVLFVAADVLRIATTCLKPFMPRLADEFLDRLQVAPEHRDSLSARLGAVTKFGSNGEEKQAPLMKKVA